MTSQQQGFKRYFLKVINYRYSLLAQKSNQLPLPLLIFKSNQLLLPLLPRYFSKKFRNQISCKVGSFSFVWDYKMHLFTKVKLKCCIDTSSFFYEKHLRDPPERCFTPQLRLKSWKKGLRAQKRPRFCVMGPLRANFPIVYLFF